jgi:hypothetical protein
MLLDKTQGYLVEVKYRREARGREIVTIAKSIHDRWHPAPLFVASLPGFFYDSCQTMIDTQHIQRLSESLIPKETQEYYLTLLQRLNIAFYGRVQLTGTA